MLTFQVEIAVGNPMGGDLTPVSASVNTGATHAMMPASLLESLQLSPDKSMSFRMANGDTVEYGIGAARFRLDGRQWTCPVVFGPENQYQLGATTLNVFGLTVDTTAPTPCLVPVTRLRL